MSYTTPHYYPKYEIWAIEIFLVEDPFKVGPHTHHKNHFGDRIFWHGRKVIFSFFLGVEAPLHDVTKGYAMDEMDWAVLTEKVHFIDIQ